MLCSSWPASITVGENEGKEGGGCLIFPLDVLEVALDAHAVSEANEATGRNDIVPVIFSKGGLACSVDEPSEVTGGFDIIFHFYPLVMVWDDASGCIGADGVHWWTVNGHNTSAYWAGWGVKEDVVGNCLLYDSLDVEDGCGWVDEGFGWGG